MISVSIDDGWKVCANSPLLIAQPWIFWFEYTMSVCSVYSPVYMCELDCHAFLLPNDWFRVGENRRDSLAG